MTHNDKKNAKNGSASALSLPAALNSEPTERGFLGALLYDPALMAQAFSKITEAHFYSERLRTIWGVMRDQFVADQTYSIRTVIEGLRAAGKLEAVGGLKAVEELTLDVGDPYNWKVLAKLMRQYTVRRRGLVAAMEAATMFANLELTVEQMIAQVHSTIYNATAEYDDLEADTDFVDTLEAWHSDPREVRGYPTGLDEIDSWTGGFGNEALVALIGYSGAGKSTLLADIMMFIIQHGIHDTGLNPRGKPIRVLVVPTEMTKEQWQIRLVAALLASNFKALKQGRFRNWGAIKEIATFVKELPIDYCQKPQPTGQDVIDDCARYDPDLVVVDGLNDMGGDSGEFENTSNNMQALHTIHKQGRLVLFSCQMNQDSKQRSNKRPNPRDARGSPSRINQLSTHILTIYRPYHLVETGEIDKDDFEREYALHSMDNKLITNPEATEIRLAKDRFGGDTGKFAIRAFIRRDGQHGFFPMPEAEYRRTAPSLPEVGWRPS